MCMCALLSLEERDWERVEERKKAGEGRREKEGTGLKKGERERGRGERLGGAD